MSEQMNVSNVMDLLGGAPSMGNGSDADTIIRVWQFGLAAGMHPQDIVLTIKKLAEGPNGADTFIDAVAFAAIFPIDAPLPVMHAGTFRKSAPYQDVVERIKDAKSAGLTPATVVEALVHDLSIERGDHPDCKPVLGELIAERKTERERGPDILPSEVNDIIEMLKDSGRPVSVIGPGGEVTEYNKDEDEDGNADD